MELNERLSNWDAAHYCPCGRWEYAHRRGQAIWQRPGDGKFSYLFAGEAGALTCDACGWDLSRSPAENIAALTPAEWAGTIRNACFGVQEPPQTLLPAGLDLATVEFVDCNLDNRLLPAGVQIVGGCHRRVELQTDGADWVCDWATGNPLEPLDVKAYLMAGLSIDPKDLPPEA